LARFILSKSKVLEQYEVVKSLADEVSYSFKTNPEVGMVLEELTDSWFSVHSLKALKSLKKPGKAWFFMQGNSAEELKEVISLGCRCFVVDNEQDMENLISFINSENVRINLLFRMKLKEHTVRTGKHFVYGFSSKKVNELIPRLRTNENIKVLGIHFHRKTQNVSEWGLKEEFSESVSKKILGLIDVVNLGGGIPFYYKNYSLQNLKHILDKVKEFTTWLRSKGIKSIIEPGRFIAAPSVKLETIVKLVHGSNVVVDASVYNAAMDTFIANIRLLVEGERETGLPFTIKGCTPDSMDILRYKVYFKNKPRVGDRIVFLNAGAYNFSTDFCGLKKPETVIID